MILDTSVLIDHLRGDQRTLEKIRSLEEHHTHLSTTAITVFELLQDTKDFTQEQLQKVIALVDSFPVHPLDRHAATEGGFIHARLQQEGMIIDAEDCMIAGIVLRHQETLLTKNVKHFKRIQGLPVETY